MNVICSPCCSLPFPSSSSYLLSLFFLLILFINFTLFLSCLSSYFSSLVPLLFFTVFPLLTSFSCCSLPSLFSSLTPPPLPQSLWWSSGQM